jgi:hypothetical protein
MRNPRTRSNHIGDKVVSEIFFQVDTKFTNSIYMYEHDFPGESACVATVQIHQRAMRNQVDSATAPFQIVVILQ